MKKLKFFTIIICLFFVIPIHAASIVGAWKLVSSETTNSSNNSNQCHSPTGLLIYTASGYVTVGFNCMKKQNSNNPSFELKDMSFYTGKYKVEGNTITHITENGSSPALYQKKLERHIDLLTDKNLILSFNQKGSRLIVKWERVN